jgi:hypothetical protein
MDGVQKDFTNFVTTKDQQLLSLKYKKKKQKKRHVWEDLQELRGQILKIRCMSAIAVPSFSI